MATNSIFDIIDLTTLPAPDVIDTPEFQVIFSEILALFRTYQTGYDLLLESDPVAKLLQAIAYRELILRNRINDAAKQTLLAFATGTNLDALGAFHNVARLVIQAANSSATPPIRLIVEDDESYRYRIQQRIPAYSNAGGEGHYRYWALSASPYVRDVKVYSPDHPNGYNMGGQVVVTVLSTEEDLVPTTELLEEVRAVLFRDDVRMVTDILSVEAAVPRAVNIVASVKLLPRTPYSVFTALQTTLETKFAEAQALGRDVTRSWLLSVLQQAGVHSVAMSVPATDVTVAPNEFPIFGDVAISFGGFSDGEALALEEMERRRTQRIIYDNYVAYAVAAKRTKDQIKADLVEKDVTGVLQPSIQGLAQFVGVENLKDDQGAYYSEDDLAYLIWLILSPSYA